MKTCKTCGSKANLITAIHNGELIEGCENCISSLKQGNGSAAKYERDWQRKEYRKDIVQPIEPREFIKAYPDKARNIYSEEAYRKWS